MDLTRSVLAALAMSTAVLVTTVAPARADVVGIVRGTLTGPDHRPIAHVTVTLTGDRTSYTATTGDDGRFAFPRVPFGHYTGRRSRRPAPPPRRSTSQPTRSSTSISSRRS